MPRLQDSMNRTPARQDLLCARVYLMESRRRGKVPFAFTLLGWAANARQRAASTTAQRQMPLFT